jgi:DNA-binding XRE family transcriptional regulator
MASKAVKMPKVVGESFRDALAERMKSPTFRYHYEQRRLVAEVALAVRAMRKQAGLTQRQLAKLVRVSQPMIARVEKGVGQRTPGWDLLRKISIALGRQMRLSFLAADVTGQGHQVEVDGLPPRAETEQTEAL